MKKCWWQTNNQWNRFVMVRLTAVLWIHQLFSPLFARTKIIKSHHPVSSRIILGRMNRLAFTFGMGTSFGLFIAQYHGDKVEFCTTNISKVLNPNRVAGTSPLAAADALLAFSTNTANKNKFAVLSTLNSNPEKGMLSSRTIQPFAIEMEDNRPVIYFNTNKLTR